MHGSLDSGVLRVLHIDTERGWRGGERQVFWLARELAQRGHHAAIAGRRSEPLGRRAVEAGLPLISCAPLFEGDPVAALRLRRTIKRERFDIVHAHTAHAVTLGAMATVKTEACLIAERRVDFRLRRNVGTRWKYGRADAIVAISEAVARVLEEGGIDRALIAVVPDATDLHREIQPASAGVLRSLGVFPGPPLVVQVAQLVDHKDPMTFVRAIAAAVRKVPSLQALLVGEGPLRPEIEDATRKLGLDGTLRLAGYRWDSDSLLAAATVVALSSREEGMGSVLLDALLLGKPVAATRAGGIPEVIEHDVSGLLSDVGDPEGLGHALVRLLTDKSLAHRLSAAATARAADFSVERMTERTLTVYRRVLAPVSARTLDRTLDTNVARSDSSRLAP